MEYKTVLDTKILSRTERTGCGQNWVVFEIVYPGFTFSPGQFVMIRGGSNTFNWSYPYMVQGATEEGFTIVSQPGGALYGCCPGDAVVVWGALGNPPAGGELTLVAQPESYHFVAPLLKLAGAKTLVMVGGEAPEAIPGGVTVVNAAGPKEASQVLSEDGGRAALALNLPELMATMANVPDALKKDALVFAYTKMGCGIGACRGCYLHSPDIKTGIAVCCEGPYLPYTKIDFETDKNCFQVFG